MPDPALEPAVWPPFFRANSGAAPSAVDGTDRLPSDLIDVFYFGDPDRGTVTLTLIAACLGGGLAAFAGRSLADLGREEPTLERQLQPLRVAQRDAFRTITAREMYIATLDAAHHASRAVGFNDPIGLTGSMQARLDWDRGEARVTPLAEPGRLTAGRLDLLHAVRMGVTAAFHPLSANADRVVPLLVPAAPVETVERGRGLVLLYPLLDPAIAAGVDNQPLVLELAFDLLTPLQEEAAAIRADHGLERILLPAPNRARLKEELILDGYEIRGDLAVKPAAAASDSAQPSSRLRRVLRALGVEPAADRVAVPRQATLDDYQLLASEFIWAVATTEDRRMFDAMIALATPPTAPVRGSLPDGVLVPPDPAPIEPRLSSPAATPDPPPTPAARRQPQNFAADFAAPARPAPADADNTPEPAGADSWSADFPAWTDGTPRARRSHARFDEDFPREPRRAGVPETGPVRSSAPVGGRR